MRTKNNVIFRIGRAVPVSLFVAFLFFAFAAPCRFFAQELPEKQRNLSERYAQLEQVLVRMSEASASTNPKRAALLKKVLLASKDKLVAMRLGRLAELLQQQRLTETVTGQEDVEKDLLELLRLLESENRQQRRAAEKEQIKQFLRDLEELIHQENNLKAKTTRQEKEQLSPLEKEQKQVRLKTEMLRTRIEEQENPGLQSREEPKQQAETPEPDKSERGAPEKSDEKKPDDKESGEKDSGEKDSDKKESDGDKESGEEPKGEEKSEPESEESAEQPRENESPALQAMRKALGRMRKAEGRLKEAEKTGALEEQEEAVAELQRVKAELEKILRQIREEELLQTLEKLEARFKRMLKIEQSIRSQTESLSKEAAQADEPRRRQIQVRSSRLAADQQSVIVEADDALVLLREDGTAQAMVESLLQARFDMTEIKSRLENTNCDAITMQIEDTVIASLEEMLEAITLAIKESEKRQESDSPPSGGGGGDGDDLEPLIQLLSELRMIRSMQRRVNERTERYEKQIEQLKGGPDADLEPFREKVEELARQQNRISRILHDLKIGKAK